MLVNCPKCHLSHDGESGKHYTCSCGAEFTVDESGKTCLSAPEPGTTQESCPLGDLSLDELKRLKTCSLYLVQWGWLSGIIYLLVAVVLPLVAYYHVYENQSEQIVAMIFNFFSAGFYAVWGVVNLYIYTSCRTTAVRVCAYTDSIFGAIACGIMILLCVLGKGGNFFSLIIYVLVLVICIFIFKAANSKLLWGKNAFSHKDIKAAYECKKNGKDIAGIVPKPISLAGKIFSVLAVLRIPLYCLFSLGLLSSLFSYVFNILRQG